MIKMEDNNKETISLSESTSEVESAPQKKTNELIFTALDRAIKEKKLGQIIEKAEGQVNKRKYSSEEPLKIETEQEITLTDKKVTSSLINFLMTPPFLLINKIFKKFDIEKLSGEEKENLKSSIVELILENWDSKIIQWLIYYLSFGDATNNFIIAIIEIAFPRILKINLDEKKGQVNRNKNEEENDENNY